MQDLANRGMRWDPFFGVVAASLGWVPPLRYLLRRRRVLSLLERIPPGGNLLEVGCGAGALLVDLARNGFVCTGLETAPRAVDIAVSVSSLSARKYEIHTTPASNWKDAFDVVCAFDVMEHVQDDTQALRQWIEWTKPGGRLLLSVPAHSRRWGAGDVWAGHYRRYDREPLRQLLVEHSLCVEHFECYGFPLANITERVGQRTYKALLEKRDASTKPEDASAESGIERDAYLRRFRKMDSVAGRLALRVNYLLQAATRRTDLGSGYLVLASKP
jgi:SAM-dependent methyltransferase